MATLRGGAKFETALREIAQQLDRPGLLRVGFLENATYPAVKGKGGPKSVAFVAAMNEWGTSRAPPRPFFRNMIAAKSAEWPVAIALNLKATGYDVPKTLALVGEGIKGQLQQSIRDLKSPPNAPSTIARKGFDDPLIESAHMLNSVDFEVKG